MKAQKINDFIICTIIGIGVVLLLGGVLDSLFGVKTNELYYEQGFGVEEYMDWRNEMR